MEALVTEPYSVTSHFFHKLSSRQPEMLPENRLQLVCNIHEENQHGCQCAPEFNYSAKPVLWGEEPSFVHTHCLHFPSPPVMASSYKDLVFILHTHSHRQWFSFFMLPNCEWALCGSARDELFHTKNTSTQTCRKWMQRHAHADAYSQTHANITPKCWKLTSSQLLRTCLPLACSHTPLSFTHHHHLFHQRCIFSNFIH